jgi:hypothetical protein
MGRQSPSIMAEEASSFSFVLTAILFVFVFVFVLGGRLEDDGGDEEDEGCAIQRTGVSRLVQM